jgi:hypothetical protein
MKVGLAVAVWKKKKLQICSSIQRLDHHIELVVFGVRLMERKEGAFEVCQPQTLTLRMEKHVRIHMFACTFDNTLHVRIACTCICTLLC